MRGKNVILGRKKMSIKDNGKVVIIRELYNKSGNRFRIKVFCKECGTELIDMEKYTDLGITKVCLQKNCEHYIWNELHCDPNNINEDNLHCLIEKPIITRLKSGIVFYIDCVDKYCVLYDITIFGKHHIYRK